MIYFLECCGKNDYRLFDTPPNEPVGFSYDFKSLYDAMMYAKVNNIKVRCI